MEKLANETLEDIFSDIRSADGSYSLVSCTRVNRAWAQITAPWLWQHIVVDQSRLGKLMEPPGLQKYGHLVQSLTVELVPYTFPDGPVDVHEWHDQILQLSNVIKTYTKNIKSFSLIVSRPGPEDAMPMFRVSAETLGAVLKALPKSCVNLEVETNGWELFHARNLPAKEHLCPYIMSLLPRLHHLRVGAASLCEKGTRKAKLSAPNMKTMTVAIHPRIPAKKMTRRESSWCYLAHQFSDWRWPENPGGFSNLHLPEGLTPPATDHFPMGRQSHGGYGDLAKAQKVYENCTIGAYGVKPPPIAGFLTRLLANLKMPSATKVDVVTYQRDQPKFVVPAGAPGTNYRQRYPEMLVVRDCVANTTQALPVKAVKYLPLLNEGPLRYNTAVMVGTDNVARVGSFWDLMEDAEGAVWATARGNRARLVKDTIGFHFEVLSARGRTEDNEDDEFDYPAGIHVLKGSAVWNGHPLGMPGKMGLWIESMGLPPGDRVPVHSGASAKIKKGSLPFIGN